MKKNWLKLVCALIMILSLESYALEIRLGYMATRDKHMAQWDYLVAGAEFANAVARIYDEIDYGSKSGNSSSRDVLAPSEPYNIRVEEKGGKISITWDFDYDYVTHLLIMVCPLSCSFLMIILFQIHSVRHRHIGQTGSIKLMDIFHMRNFIGAG